LAGVFQNVFEDVVDVGGFVVDGKCGQPGFHRSILFLFLCVLGGMLARHRLGQDVVERPVSANSRWRPKLVDPVFEMGEVKIGGGANRRRPGKRLFGKVR
jgi:hypothetical protein